MAKFYNNGPVIFQEPIEKTASDGSKSVSMGFRVAICDNGDGDDASQAYNASVIVRCLNQDQEIKELATWLLAQSGYLGKDRIDLLKRIVDA